MSQQSTINFIRFAFIILSLLAFYTILITSNKKGFYQFVNEVIVTGKLSRSPDGVARLLESFTSVPALDKLAKALVVCFWPVVCGENPSLSLLGVPAVVNGCLVSSARAGGTADEVVAQRNMEACVGWVAPNDLFSGLYSPNPIPHVMTSLILCIYTRMALVTFPSPTVISHSLKQAVLAFMIPWAFWLFVMVFIASCLFPIEVQEGNSRQTVYIFALGIAATTHLGALLASVLYADLGL
ncbi:hypothetical protein BDW72DRAFT_195550 [Aspergillus terricola var. indicus]